ncbi:MAG: hypothetical protein J6B13_07000, partial [Muribaculaceae bacterium]|nr:hypothetical protein [Muribaculaceae bacterium]
MQRQPQPRLCRGYRPSFLDRRLVEIYPGIYSFGTGDSEILLTAASRDEAMWQIIGDIMRPPPCAAALYMVTPLSNESHPRPRQPSLPEASAHDPPH